MSKAWMPLYVADYLADTGHLNHEEHGVYLLAMMHQWQTEKPLPTNVKQLLVICRCFDTAKFEELWGTVSTLFTLTDEGWINERMMYEIEKSNKISRKRAKAGAVGGAKSVQNQSKSQANAQANENHLPTQSQSQSQSQSQPDKNLKTYSVKSDDVTRHFDDEVVKFVRDYQEYVAENLGNRAPKITDTLITNCCDTVDKLIRLDGHSLEQIRAVLRWAAQDEFWSNQVYSLASLRRAKDGLTKYQKLLSACEKECKQSIRGGDVLRVIAGRGGKYAEREGEGVYQVEDGGPGGPGSNRDTETKGHDAGGIAVVRDFNPQARRDMANW